MEQGGQPKGEKKDGRTGRNHRPAVHEEEKFRWLLPVDGDTNGQEGAAGKKACEGTRRRPETLDQDTREEEKRK
jgi:hypothetical protein